MAKKKRDMTDHEHRVYKQNHGYDFPLDEEQAKIARERSEHRKLRKQSARKQRALLDDLESDEYLEVEDWDEIDQLEERARREIRNARTHKRRLRQLGSREPDDYE